METTLKELCMEVVNQNINGERFMSLIVETGVKLESQEWDLANKLLEKTDEMNVHLKRTKNKVH